MVDASNFGSKSAHGNRDSGNFFRFGLDIGETVAALREFANQIELGNVLVGKVRSDIVADHNEWCKTTLVIEYVVLEKGSGS